MHLSSAAAVLSLSSLGASYVLPFIHPQQANDHLMRRSVPYAVVNVDGDSDGGESNTSSEIQTTVQTVTASNPPPPPVTVTVTSTPSLTPTVSPTISSCPSSSSSPVPSSEVPSSSSFGTFSTMPIPKPSGVVSSALGSSSTTGPYTQGNPSSSSITPASSIAARVKPSWTFLSGSRIAASTGVN